MKDLDPVLRDEIDVAFHAARALFALGFVDPSIVAGEAAWAMLPTPKFEWDVSKSYVDTLVCLYRDTQRKEPLHS